MKKTVLLLTFLVFYSIGFEAKAQIFRAKAGFNLASIRVKDELNIGNERPKMNPGFHLGMMAEFPLVDRFSVESGLMLNSRGVRSDLKGSNFEESYNTSLYYLDLPVTAKYAYPVGEKKNARIFAAAGPYIALGIFGSQKIKTTTAGRTEQTRDIYWWDSGSPMKQFEFGATAGAGIEFKKMQFGVYYDMGLTKLTDFDPIDFSTRNRVLRFSIGYRLSRKRSENN